MILEYDVAVVGAGPAGCVAARFAAERGAHVVLIDRKHEIGNPVRCAEVVAGTLPGNFGMRGHDQWLINESRFFKLVSPKGREISINTAPYKGYVLDRSSFERELAAMAVDSGAELVLGRTVTGISPDGLTLGKDSMGARIIIAADGVDSKLGRMAGFRTRERAGGIGSCAQHTLVGIDVDRDCLEFHLGSRYAPGGYAWVFPKNENEANVGVGILRSSGITAVDALERFVKGRFPRGRSIRFISGCVPSSMPPQECVRNNVLLIGDAARQTNPFSGAGIANAFVAGKIAGTLGGECTTKNQSLGRLLEYDSMWKEVMEKKLRKSLRLRNRVLLKDRNTEMFLLLLKIIPGFILRKLARQLHY